MRKHIFLIGFMGTGKSTISRRLKMKMDVDEIDMDQAIVNENGMSINEMFQQFGEEYFREKETRILYRLSMKKPSIISCGGGTVLRPVNVDIMKKNGQVVLLTATPETVFQRVRNDRERPILNGHMNVEYIAQLMEKRRAAYESASDLVISTDHKTPDEIAEEIMEFCK